MRIRRWIGRGWRLLRLALLLIVLLLLLSDGISVDRTLRGRAVALVRDHLYDYVGWEADALWGKLRQELFGVHPYLDEARRETLVYDYLTRLAEAQALVQFAFRSQAVARQLGGSLQLGMGVAHASPRESGVWGLRRVWCPPVSRPTLLVPKAARAPSRAAPGQDQRTVTWWRPAGASRSTA